jgi:putative SOS response-associated peptidase YedK
MINARSETATTKLAFRDALKSRKCLIPADGFTSGCEREKPNRRTILKSMRGELFAFAGIGDRSKDPSGNWMKTCSILTTTANAVT